MTQRGSELQAAAINGIRHIVEPANEQNLDRLLVRPRGRMKAEQQHGADGASLPLTLNVWSS